MRSSLSIIKATALEILSGPLTLLVLLSALALTVLAPTFHYHQFGDPTRMARDAGFSALFTCGSVIAVFGTIRAFRREVETGTLEMALAHPLSRTMFFLSKTVGAFLAYVIFALIVLGTTMVVFEGAEVGGIIARQSGDIARIYGPCLAVGIGIIVLPLVIAATLNRFVRCRFVLSSVMLAFVFALIAAGVVIGLARWHVLRLIAVAVLLMQPAAVLLVAAASFAVRLRANAAAAATGGLLAVSLPAIGNYYLVDALADGGSLAWGYVGVAVAVTLPAVIAFLLLGVHFINGRDVLWTT